MEKVFKQFVYSYVGMVAWTADKFQDLVKQLIEEKKISTEEGKKIVDELFKNTEEKRDDFQSHLTDLVEKTMKNFRFATSADIETIEKRIKALENGKAKTTTKSTTRRKTTTSSTTKKATAEASETKK